ncbi:unnamed protein product [Schistocephalus solidus]|uniref:Transposase n=1 Tax=Schistocephalus solidus TaxID=70667 RepID=A0A183SBC6_SCHSO|nr:unnamed protein product [Schistocephalus solidus]
MAELTTLFQSDAIPPEVYKHGGPRLMAELTTIRRNPTGSLQARWAPADGRTHNTHRDPTPPEVNKHAADDVKDEIRHNPTASLQARWAPADGRTHNTLPAT